MSFFVAILTFLLVVNCVVLIFLVLIQLPKKDAGAGMAFGGGAADALFGAGSGNTLTKITKWAAGIFFALALIFDFAEGRMHHGISAADLQKAVEQSQQTQQSQMPVTAPPTTPLPAAAPTTNNPLVLPLTAPATGTTNSP